MAWAWQPLRSSLAKACKLYRARSASGCLDAFQSQKQYSMDWVPCGPKTAHVILYYTAAHHTTQHIPQLTTHTTQAKLMVGGVGWRAMLSGFLGFGESSHWNSKGRLHHDVWGHVFAMFRAPAQGVGGESRVVLGVEACRGHQLCWNRHTTVQIWLRAKFRRRSA